MSTLSYQEDARYNIMFKRFVLLTEDELLNILENINLVCFDTFNYEDGKYCPLAIAKKIPRNSS